MNRISSSDLARASLPALVRLAAFLRCLPRQRQPGESDGAYKHRLVHAILRAEKELGRAPKIIIKAP